MRWIMSVGLALVLVAQDQCDECSDCDNDGWTTEDGDCDDRDQTSHPGADEECDGRDNDCNGDADTGVVGGDPICAGASCNSIKEGRGNQVLEDGVYWIDPTASRDAFDVFCDMTIEGGGWTLVWKNTGGPSGSMADSTLFSSEGVDMVYPHNYEQGSARHKQAWDTLLGAEGRQWMKFARLWQDGIQVHSQFFIASFGEVAMSDVLPLASTNTSTYTCHLLPDAISINANGVDAGATNYAFEWYGNGVGLANQYEDRCGQEESNLIANPEYYRLTSETTLALSTAEGWNSVRHLFTYAYGSNNTSRSRCNYRCWENEYPTQPFYDGYEWYIR